MDLRFTYDQIAEEWHQDHLKDDWWIEGTAAFAALFPKGSRILDVGCAGGVKAQFLIDRGLSVRGVDLSPAFIAIAKRECPRGIFQVLDMRDVAELDERFDGVFAQASLLHIPKKEVSILLRTFASVLKPGGYLYLAVKEVRPGQPEEELVQENDYGYEYTRFFSYFKEGELERELTLLGFDLAGTSIVQAQRTNWIQVIAQKPLIMIGGRYRHCKGGEYRVLQVATHTENGEEFVVYQSETDGKVWTRPLGMFLEEVEFQGKSVPRFLFLGP